jgi:prephenate dehydrogenase
MSEDDYLLTEILFNPHTSGQLEQIRKELANLIGMIEIKDSEAMKDFLCRIRQKISPVKIERR